MTVDHDSTDSHYLRESLTFILNNVHTEGELWTQSCRQLIIAGKFKMAWVGIKSDDYRIVPLASYGDDDGFLSHTTIHWDESLLGKGPSGIAIRSGETVVWRDLITNPDFSPWRKLAFDNHFHAIISIPLFYPQEAPWGVLTIYAHSPEQLDSETVHTLEIWAHHLKMTSHLIKSRLAAKKDQTLLDLVLNYMLDVIIQVNKDDQIYFASPSVTRTFGYDPNRILDLHLYNYIHPNDQPLYAAWRHNVLQMGEHSTQLRMLHTNGTYIWTEIVGIAHTIDEINTTDFVMIIRDISKYKHVQNQIQRLATVAENTDNMVVITDPQHHIEWVNQAFITTTGYRFDEVIGHKPGELLKGPDKDTEIINYMHTKLDVNEGFTVDLLNYKKSGEAYWVSADIQPVFSDNGQLIHYIAIESDITEHKSELLRMKSENDILRWIQRMSDILLFIDKIQSVWTQFRDMAIQLLGIHAGVYIIPEGESWRVQDWFGLDGINVDSFLRHIEEDAKESLDIDQEHYRFIQNSDRLKNEEGIHSIHLVSEFRYDIYLDQRRHSVIYLYYIQPDAVLRPIVLSLMEFFRLALQVVTQRELLKNQNEQDPLTLISNRRGLETHMESYFVARRPVPSVFLLFDLDGFKNLNDSFGHQQGDHALKMVAQYFKQNIRTGDWIARLGGDEFVLVLHEAEWNDTLARKLQLMITESPLQQRSLSLTMGAVVLPLEAKNFQEAYRLADERLYLGKKHGKKRIIGPQNESLFI
jgi:diguanylate cyclase (GGDEF)-like protein/PAS domain S-box-containing protein